VPVSHCGHSGRAAGKAEGAAAARGAILWKIAGEHARDSRAEFTNRELRLDPALRLPEYAENLEARLVLLQRRLFERNAGIAIDKCGRGRFRLVVDGRLALEEI
jgi:hypothetical protein